MSSINPATIERLIESTVKRVVDSIQTGFAQHDLHIGQRDAERDGKFNLELGLLRKEIKELERAGSEGRQAIRDELREVRTRLAVVRRDQTRLLKAIEPEDPEKAIVSRIHRLEHSRGVSDEKLESLDEKVCGA